MPRTIITLLLLIILSPSAWAKSPICYAPTSPSSIDLNTVGLTVERVIFDDDRSAVTIIAVRSTGERINGLPRSPEVIVLHGNGSISAETVEVGGGTEFGTLRVGRQGDSIHAALILGSTSTEAVLSRQP